MNPAASIVAVALVAFATLAIGALGLRLSRTTSDFYVASRSVGPVWNASAIGGEYLSAGSFLGVAGLVLAYGADMLWYPVGWTAGYLVLLVLVAAPLRRSGAYTLPDFAEARLESRRVRRISSVLVVAIGWLYLLPQFQGAGLTLQTVTGAPAWVGGVVVAVIVMASVLSGGMRSITFVQAFQYWLKLTALLVPLAFLLLRWGSDGWASPADAAVGPGALSGEQWVLPLSSDVEHPVYATYSLILATFLGTMGLPHVLVRFYTNPDGRAARRTTLVVLVLLGAFYLLPAFYGALGRLYAPDLLSGGGTGSADSVVLELPARMVAGALGDALGALVTAGAFAAFLSTSSGLTVSVAGVLSQDVLGRWLSGVTAFRVAGALAVLVPLMLALLAQDLPIANVVGLAFAVAASTFCPLLVLGIWWRRLTDVGAMAGLLVGGSLAGAAVILTVLGFADGGWLGALLGQPGAWAVPVAFVVMVAVSLAAPRRIAPNVSRTMVRLHLPEQIDVNRGDFAPPGATRRRPGVQGNPRGGFRRICVIRRPGLSRSGTVGPMTVRARGLTAALAVVVAVGCALTTAVVQHVFVQTAGGQALDQAVLHQAAATPVVVAQAAEGALQVFTVPFAALACVAVVVVSVVRRSPWHAVAALVVVVGANATTQVLKHLVIERPDLLQIGAPNSLPSGHTTVVASLALGLAMVAPPALRFPAAILGLMGSTLVGVATILVGWHRLSDVVAALLVSTAWAALVLAVLVLRPRRPLSSTVTSTVASSEAAPSAPAAPAAPTTSSTAS